MSHSFGGTLLAKFRIFWIFFTRLPFCGHIYIAIPINYIRGLWMAPKDIFLVLLTPSPIVDTLTL